MPSININYWKQLAFLRLWHSLYSSKSFSFSVQTFEPSLLIPVTGISLSPGSAADLIIDLKAATHIFLLGWHYSYYISPISQSLGPAPSDYSRPASLLSRHFCHSLHLHRSSPFAIHHPPKVHLFHLVFPTSETPPCLFLSHFFCT